MTFYGLPKSIYGSESRLIEACANADRLPRAWRDRRGPVCGRRAGRRQAAPGYSGTQSLMNTTDT